jgi:hypothetical protein
MTQQLIAAPDNGAPQGSKEFGLKVFYTRLRYGGAETGIAGGGYSIKSAAIPSLQSTHAFNLLFGTQPTTANQRILNIHPRRHGGDLEFFDVDRRVLSEFLTIVGRNSWWERHIYVWVEAMSGARRSAVSRAASIKTPVEPVRIIGPNLAKHPKLIYPRNADGKSEPGAGRSVGKNTSLDGKYYFVYGGQFETEARYRGFDCSSFVKMAVGLPTTSLTDPSGRHLALSGPNIAAAKGLDLAFEDRDRLKVIAFLRSSSVANSFSIIQRDEGKHGHCVFVADGNVLEFNVPRATAIGLEPGYKKAADIGEKPLEHKLFDLYGGGYVTPIEKWRENDHKPASYRVFSRQLLAGGRRNSSVA